MDHNKPIHEEVERVQTEDDTMALKHQTLGHVRLRHEDTNEIILIPAPSLNPNDPLRW